MRAVTVWSVSKGAARGRGAAVLLAITVGCTEGEGEGGPAGPATEPERFVDVTLVAQTLDGTGGPETVFWEVSSDGDGFIEPYEPLWDVTVCVAKARPYQRGPVANWEAFESVDQCHVTKEGVSVTFTGLPANHELILTAEKDDFRPIAFTMMTEQHDLDHELQLTPPPPPALRLRRTNSEPAHVPSADTLDTQLGEIWFGLRGCGPVGCRDLGGARVHLRLEGDPADAQGGGLGPFYSDLGRWVVSDTSLAGTNLELEHHAVFVNLEEGEYRVVVDHPGASCSLSSTNIHEWIHGYPADANEIRVPVLKGHTTVGPKMWCECNDWNMPNPPDANTCARATGDAGSP